MEAAELRALGSANPQWSNQQTFIKMEAGHVYQNS